MRGKYEEMTCSCKSAIETFVIGLSRNLKFKFLNIGGNCSRKFVTQDTCM